jgi:ElaB/YqjD/DUF883 family membrane-anchored ribosome-binding protein
LEQLFHLRFPGNLCTHTYVGEAHAAGSAVRIFRSFIMTQASERILRGKSNGAARGALKSRTDDVLEDFAELRKDVGRLYDAANQAARSEIRFAKNRVGQLTEDLRGQASERAEYVSEQVRLHPYAAIGASLGVGLLLGLLAKRR